LSFWIYANNCYVLDLFFYHFKHFRIVGLFYWIIDVYCLAKILITCLHVLGIGWRTKRWNSILEQ